MGFACAAVNLLGCGPAVPQIRTTLQSTMATGTVGKLEAFDPDTDSITVYLERVEIYFAANSILGEKWVAVLLSLICPITPFVGPTKAC